MGDHEPHVTGLVRGSEVFGVALRPGQVARDGANVAALKTAVVLPASASLLAPPTLVLRLVAFETSATLASILPIVLVLLLRVVAPLVEAVAKVALAKLETIHLSAELVGLATVPTTTVASVSVGMISPSTSSSAAPTPCSPTASPSSPPASTELGAGIVAVLLSLGEARASAALVLSPGLLLVLVVEGPRPISLHGAVPSLAGVVL